MTNYRYRIACYTVRRKGRSVRHKLVITIIWGKQESDHSFDLRDGTHPVNLFASLIDFGTDGLVRESLTKPK